MGAAAVDALTTLFTLETLPFILLGVVVGMVVGLLPGLGGVAGMSIVLPFIFGMEPNSAIAMMVGLMAVICTSDTFPSVLLGVPGSASSQATVMDGYPMAKNGEAGRALGAAFFVSMVGGVFGAFVLFAVLPVARPIILALGAPELFMLALFGLALVGALSRGAPVAGLVAGLVGMLLAAIGHSPTGHVRLTGDIQYLRSGISLMILALGLFAIPEMIDLLRSGNPIAGKEAKVTGKISEGIRDALRNKRLILASSTAGVTLGMLPGLGGSVIDWLTYGLASRFCKNNEMFGKGDIRGVIAPESANNAKEGGALIPTLLFGLPGSGTTALLLGALMVIGVTPGPSLLEDDNISIILLVVWSLVFANILATGVAMLLTKQLIKISLIRPVRLVPILTVIISVAAYQNTRQWGDLVVLFGIGALGWVMKEARWPRPPVLVGFVLGTPAERYLGIAYGRYELTWLTNPGVIAIGIATIAVIVYGLGRGARIPLPDNPEDGYVGSAKGS